MLLALLAVLPILVVGILLIGYQWPASRAMPICYAIAAGLALFVWQVPPVQVAAATSKGLLIVGELLFIIFGAVLLLHTLEDCGVMGKIQQNLASVSSDRRIQVIIIAWLFGSFIEGASGFGTPAVLAVPLLIGLGFPPLAAVFAGVAIQCTPVSFGAAGTPILVGVSTGLAGASNVEQYLEEHAYVGTQGWLEFLQQIGWRVALIHASLGLLIPLLLVCLMTFYFGANRSFREGLAVWRFALFAALAMLAPYLAAAYFLGPEFPSLLGGSIGLVIVMFTAHRGWFLPDPADTWDFPPTDEQRPAIPTPVLRRPQTMETRDKGGTLSAWLPYFLVALFLVVSRIVPSVKSELLSYKWCFPDILGTSIGHEINFLYSPGTIFVVVSLISFFYYIAVDNFTWTAYRHSWRRAAETLSRALPALFFAVPMVQVFINSGKGSANYNTMPLELAGGIEQIVGSAWPLAAPFVGGLGAAIAGSNTVSNMMFSLFQFEVGSRIAVDPIWIVALQAVGGAAGNTVCVHNIIAASAVAGISGYEGIVIRKTFWVFFYYALTPGIVFLFLLTYRR